MSTLRRRVIDRRYPAPLTRVCIRRNHGPHKLAEVIRIEPSGSIHVRTYCSSRDEWSSRTTVVRLGDIVKGVTPPPPTPSLAP